MEDQKAAGCNPALAFHVTPQVPSFHTALVKDNQLAMRHFTLFWTISKAKRVGNALKLNGQAKATKWKMCRETVANKEKTFMQMIFPLDWSFLASYLDATASI